jgi:hypothetical protein
MVSVVFIEKERCRALIRKEHRMMYWAYVLLGNNNTGKTSFQKEMIAFISHEKYQRLERNKVVPVATSIGANNTKKVSFMNRSLQESYNNVDGFFSSDFQAVDACVLSSHLVQPDIEAMIKELKMHVYNVCGVFFQNSCEIGGGMEENRRIALLDWDEKYFIKNPQSDDPSVWEQNLRQGAWELSNHLLNKL